MATLRGSIALPTLYKEHIFIGILFDFLYEHFEEVGGTHARPRSNLAVKGLRQLLCLLVKREYQFKLTMHRTFEFSLRWQLVVIRNLKILGSARCHCLTC